MAGSAKRTIISQQGLDFVTLFAATFVHTKVSGYRPLLREPHADSTAGGKQALQHIVFEPEIAGDALMTVGSVNVATKVAKLRTYDCLSEMHVLRFGNRPFPVDQAQYQDFFDRAKAFLERQQMQIEIETRPPGGVIPSMAPPPPTGGAVVLWALAVAFIAIAVAVIYFVVAGRLVW